MRPIYLLSSNSTIAGYKTVSFTKPTSTTIKNISIYGQGSLLVGQWISSAFVFSSPLTIEATYLWLFAIYANTSSQAFLYGEFYLYRSGSESLLFQSANSGNVNNGNVSLLIWQDRTKQNITLISGDRLIFKLYFTASLGLHTFAYDCSFYPSYIKEPTETRYLRKATWTLNGTTYKKLQTSSGDNTYETFYKLAGRAVSNASWGIRVFNRTSSGTEQEITSGSPVALVNRTANNANYQAQSNTWNCPASNWDSASNCSLLIKWYVTFDNNSTWYKTTYDSVTEGLSSNYLNASTWTITYYTLLISKATPTLAAATMAYDGLEESGNYYPTRIANIIYVSADFTAPYYYNVIVNENTLASGYNDLYCNWTEVGSVKSALSKYRYGQNNSGTFTYSLWIPASFGVTTENFTATFLNNNTVGNIIAVKWECNDTSGNLNDTMPYQYYTITSSKSWRSIELFTFDLLTRKWLPIESFLFDFLTRSWLSISDWSFDLLTRNWSDIASWNFDLLTRTWSEVATFNLDLLTRSWLSVLSWVFNLTYPMWHYISLYSFQLRFGEDVSFLLIPILFLFILAVSVIVLGICLQKR